jgi:NitT/TauT family transport system substrate-binding protein
MMLPTRRQLLATLSGTAVAGLFGGAPASADEGPPETRRIRIGRTSAICVVPKYAAEELLRAEGFVDVRYVDVKPADVVKMTAAGELDLEVNYTVNFIKAIDGGAPLTLLAGVHVGCFELFARDNIRGIGDLRGKIIGDQRFGSTQHLLVVMLMAAQVGIDPVKDIRWVTDPKVKPMRLFVAGKIDAFLAFPPEPWELRARKIGHVLLNTALDRPWSQYFCCMLAGNPEFVRRHPVATKRAVRAILKAVELCASNPARVARQLVDGRFIKNYDYALQMLRDLPYDWRDYQAEDTVRFYALRMREAGFIKSTPQQIIANNTDWRFLNDLRRELKA